MVQTSLNHKIWFHISGAASLIKERVERRNYRRFKVCWEAVIEGKNNSGAKFREKARLLDVSSTGAYLQVSAEVRAGAKLMVSIRIPLGDRNWISYQARVVRVEKLEAAQSIAVRFESLRPTFANR